MSASVDRKTDLRRRIQQLQASLSRMEQQEPSSTPEAASSSEPVSVAAEEEDATLSSVSQKVSDSERRLLGRFVQSEKFLLNQLDEQLLGTLMIVGLFILTAFYVFYFLMENLLRLRRCRCPEVPADQWHTLVRAATYQCKKEMAETLAATNAAAPAAVAAPAPAPAAAAAAAAAAGSV